MLSNWNSCIMRRTSSEFQRRTLRKSCTKFTTANGLVLGMYDNGGPVTNELFGSESTTGLIQRTESTHLPNWRFQGNEHDPFITPKLELYDLSSKDAWIRGPIETQSKNVARDLCKMASNQLTSTAFAQAATMSCIPAVQMSRCAQ